jgi:hypothetical protein
VTLRQYVRSLEPRNHSRFRAIYPQSENDFL